MYRLSFLYFPLYLLTDDDDDDDDSFAITLKNVTFSVYESKTLIKKKKNSATENRINFLQPDEFFFFFLTILFFRQRTEFYTAHFNLQSTASEINVRDWAVQKRIDSNIVRLFSSFGRIFRYALTQYLSGCVLEIVTKQKKINKYFTLKIHIKLLLFI